MVRSGEPTLYHHALCVTDDVPATAGALASITPAQFTAILGHDSAGTIELAPLPEELNGRLVPGTTAISFAVDDLDERVTACRAAGLDVIVAAEPASALSYAVVSVAGLEFELVQFVV
jgi:hypothetical protein